MWVAEFLLNWATSLSGITNMTGAIIVALMAVAIGLFVWHRNRLKQKMPGIQIWHWLIGGIALTWIGATITLVSVGLLIFRGELGQTFASPDSAQKTAVATNSKNVDSDPAAVIDTRNSESVIASGNFTTGQGQLVRIEDSKNITVSGNRADFQRAFGEMDLTEHLSPEYERLSNEELKKSAISLASELRQLQAKLNSKNNYTFVSWDTKSQPLDINAYVRITDEMKLKFTSKYRGKALAILASITKRLGGTKLRVRAPALALGDFAWVSSA